jgi:hypothetical protein
MANGLRISWLLSQGLLLGELRGAANARVAAVAGGGASGARAYAPATAPSANQRRVSCQVELTAKRVGCSFWAAGKCERGAHCRCAQYG